jgi:phage shock protein C
MTTPRPLTRSTTDSVIAGVCAGIARHFDWEVSVVRIVAVVLGVFSGVGVLIYIAAWVIIPADNTPVSHSERAVSWGKDQMNNSESWQSFQARMNEQFTGKTDNQTNTGQPSAGNTSDSRPKSGKSSGSAKTILIVVLIVFVVLVVLTTRGSALFLVLVALAIYLMLRSPKKNPHTPTTTATLPPTTQRFVDARDAWQRRLDEVHGLFGVPPAAAVPEPVVEPFYTHDTTPAESTELVAMPEAAPVSRWHHPAALGFFIVLAELSALATMAVQLGFVQIGPNIAFSSSWAMIESAWMTFGGAYLAIMGAGLIASLFFGRPRWLIPTALTSCCLIIPGIAISHVLGTLL